MMRFALLVPLALLAACERRPESPPASVETEIPDAADPGTPPPPVPSPSEPRPATRPETGAPDNPLAIPFAFRGDWAASAAFCGTRDDRNLTVTADRLRFWESEGVVVDLDVEGVRQAIVEARYTGEGESWTASSRLALSPDGNRLTITRQGSAAIRVRCP